ncbi:MAG: MFS transporter [Kofleriaceae bacterium]
MEKRPAPLSREQRTWRTKVFVATWLSYVGFYFCRKPFSAAKSAIGEQMTWSATTLANIYAAYLIAYALGQYLASQTGPRLGPRLNVLIGMGASIVVTFAMGFTESPWVMGGMIFVNGIAQATGWSGNVGTMGAWFHKHERGRVMGIWSTNFTVGSVVSGLVMGWVLSMHDPGLPAPWRWTFFVGSAVLVVVWLQFYVLQRNKPEDVGLAPVDDPQTDADESKDTGPAPRLTRDAWINIFVVGGFYFCAKFVRYAIWSWAAYFLVENYKLSHGAANAYSIVFDLCGLPGIFLTGYISDRFFGARRGGVALIMMIGMCISCALLVQFGGANVTVFIVLLGAVGFTLFGPDALLSGAGAVDIGGRHHATFVTGVIATCGAIGPVLQEVVIGRMYDSKGGDLGPVFVMLFAGAAVGTLCCLVLVVRNRKGGRGV